MPWSTAASNSLFVRRGKAVARIEPLRRGTGRDVKELLSAARLDPARADELAELRTLLEVDDRA